MTTQAKQYKTKAIEYSIKATKQDFNKIKVSSSYNAVEYARKFYFDDIDIYESFFIILLNRANNTVGYAKISQGGTVGTVVDKKIIAKYAVDSLASGVILVHNHPSGNTKPSESDKIITKETKIALKTLDIQVLDHIIITSESFYSFADNGDMY